MFQKASHDRYHTRKWFPWECLWVSVLKVGRGGSHTGRITGESQASPTQSETLMGSAVWAQFISGRLTKTAVWYCSHPPPSAHPYPQCCRGKSREGLLPARQSLWYWAMPSPTGQGLTTMLSAFWELSNFSLLPFFLPSEKMKCVCLSSLIPCGFFSSQ